MKSKTVQFGSSLLLLILVIGCGDIELQNALTEQEKQIENFVTSFEQEQIVLFDGVWRVVEEPGEGRELAKGDSLTFEYALYQFSSGKGSLFDTNILELAKLIQLGYDYSYFFPREGVVGKGELLSALDIGLIGAREGERAIILTSARHGFGNREIGMIPKNSPLYIEIFIREVKKN